MIVEVPSPHNTEPVAIRLVDDGRATKRDGWWIDTEHVDGRGWRWFARPDVPREDVVDRVRERYGRV